MSTNKSAVNQEFDCFKKTLKSNIDTYFPVQNEWFRICLCGKHQVDVKQKNPYTMHYAALHARGCTAILSRMKEVDSVGFNCIKRWTFANNTRNLRINPLFEDEPSQNIQDSANSIIRSQHTIGMNTELVFDSDALKENLEKYRIELNPLETEVQNNVSSPSRRPNLSDLFFENSCVFKTRFDLPESTGLYLVRFLNNSEWNNLYVGYSSNLRKRWSQHHRKPEIDFLTSIGVRIECRYIAETPLFRFRGSINQMEKQLIDELKPVLNNSTVKKLVRA